MDSAGKVLAFLEKNRGSFISGEEMAAEVGISRNGIWKAIQNLRKQGYQIEAVTRKGYCLPKDSDILSEQGIRSFLKDSASPVKMYVYNEIGSTNTKAMELALAGEPGPSCVAAAAQTAGMAHNDHGFSSPEGGVYVSIFLRKEQIPVSHPRLMIPKAALAVKHALFHVSGVSADIYGINDIYHKEKKIGGILTEVSSDLETGSIQWMVIGMGVNVPISKRNAVTAAIIDELLCPEINEDALQEEYFAGVQDKKEFITRDWLFD